MQIKLIFTTKVSHLTSFLKWELGTRKWRIHSTEWTNGTFLLISNIKMIGTLLERCALLRSPQEHIKSHGLHNHSTLWTMISLLKNSWYLNLNLQYTTPWDIVLITLPPKVTNDSPVSYWSRLKTHLYRVSCMCKKGFLNRSVTTVSYWSRPVSTAYCRSTSGDSVGLLSGTISITVIASDWCITNQ